MRNALIIMVFGCVMTTSADAVESQPPTAPQATADPSQRMICRRDKETGSLIRVKKTCHTKAQWAYIDDVNQQFSRDLVDSTRGKPSGQ